MCPYGTAFANFECRIEPAHRPFHEAANFVGTAKQVTPALPLWLDFLRPDRVLGKTRPRTALAVLCITPDGFHGLGIGSKAEVEAQLPGAALAKQHGVHQRPGYG